MEVIMQEVVDTLQANGGSMAYRPLYDAVSYQAKQRLYPTLRQMKNAGQVTLANPVDPKTRRATFVVTLVGGGGD